MSEKRIVVCCPTQKTWDKVCPSADLPSSTWSTYGPKSCIRPSTKTYGDIDCYTDDNHIFITVEEYLKEVKNEVIFHVGDRVKILQGHNIPDLAWIKAMDESVGTIAIINSIAVNGFISFKDLPCVYDKSWLKLLTNKPTTTKEETTMNKNIVAAFPKTEDAVLVEAQLGNQIDDKFITGLVLKNYSKEVLAEAVTLKKAAEK